MENWKCWDGIIIIIGSSKLNIGRSLWKRNMNGGEEKWNAKNGRNHHILFRGSKTDAIHKYECEALYIYI